MLLIFLASNLLLFLTTGLVHDTDFWICYAFVVFAFITLWGSAFRQEDSSMEYLFAITRIRINTLYVILALIAAIVVYVVDVPQVLFYGIQIAIALIFIIILLLVSDVDDRHAEIEIEVKKKTDFIHTALYNVDEIKLLCYNDALQRKANLMMDLLMSAQSTPLGMELESEASFLMYADNLKRKLKAQSFEESMVLFGKMEKELTKRSNEIGFSRK